MDRATNHRLRELDRRLQQVYREAYETAIRNNEKAIERLAAFMKRDNSDMTPEQLLTAQINYTRQVERNTGILHSIAGDMANGGSRAAQLIQGESLNIYELGYRNSLTSINRQLGVDVDWSIYDRNQLRVLMMDEPKSPFTQVAYNRLGVSPNRASRVIIPRLQNQLLQSVILGESIPQITRRLQHVVNMSLYDARRIARTETLRTANQGRMLGFKQAQEEYDIPMQKQWLAAIDDRTRDTHSDINGEIREMDEAFSNGLMFPLDPAGPPEEVIQCRCTVTSILKGFDFPEKRLVKEGPGKYVMKTGDEIAKKPLNSSQFDDIVKAEKALMEVSDREEGYIIDRNGKVIHHETGKAHSVSPPSHLVKDNTFTHNHPGGVNALTGGDIQAIMGDDGYSVRVVTSDGRFTSLTRGSKGWDDSLFADMRRDRVVGYRLLSDVEAELQKTHGRGNYGDNERAALIESKTNNWLRNNASTYGATFTEGVIP